GVGHFLAGGAAAQQAGAGDGRRVRLRRSVEELSVAARRQAVGRDDGCGGGPRAVARAAGRDRAGADGRRRDSHRPPCDRILPGTEVFHERSSTDELEVSSEAHRRVGAQRWEVSGAPCLPLSFPLLTAVRLCDWASYSASVQLI